VYSVLFYYKVWFAAACVNLNGLPDSNKAIGLMYQKALVVNFFLCILITPTLYLSDRLLLKIGLSNYFFRY
jgi:hypothetical protein